MASLLDGFADAVRHHPDGEALCIGRRQWTYRQLAARAAQICGAIETSGLSRQPAVALLAGQSLTAYASVIALLASHRPFVPIDPNDPPARIAAAVASSGADTIVVGREAVDRLGPLLDEIGHPLVVVIPEEKRLDGIVARHRRHRIVDGGDVEGHRQPLPLPATRPKAPACLLQTSGTTDRPRSVVISHENLRVYLDNIEKRYELGPDDRCSHTFPLSFDLSLHDMLATWSAGATLVVWPSSRRGDPARFIEEQRLTQWFCVPTVAMGMQRLGELNRRRFSTLRHSFFGGQALPTEVARSWADAAPNSLVVNFYGPAEATVAISTYRFGGDQLIGDEDRPVVPLGRVFENQQARVVDDQGRQIYEAGRGELWLSGSQLVEGYHGQSKGQKQAFVEQNGRTWFRTGDIVELDAFGCLHFLGRRDERIKLRGHHVDLQEVDQALRRACGHPMAAAVAWPADETGVYGLVGLVVSDEPVDDSAVLAGCRRRLTPAAVPDRIVTVEELPTNKRDKLDRQAMQRMLRDRED